MCTSVRALQSHNISGKYKVSSHGHNHAIQNHPSCSSQKTTICYFVCTIHYLHAWISTQNETYGWIIKWVNFRLGCRNQTKNLYELWRMFFKWYASLSLVPLVQSHPLFLDLCWYLHISGQSNSLEKSYNIPGHVKLPPIQTMSSWVLKSMVIIVPSFSKC